MSAKYFYMNVGQVFLESLKNSTFLILGNKILKTEYESMYVFLRVRFLKYNQYDLYLANLQNRIRGNFIHRSNSLKSFYLHRYV